MRKASFIEVAGLASAAFQVALMKSAPGRVSLARLFGGSLPTGSSRGE